MGETILLAQDTRSRNKTLLLLYTQPAPASAVFQRLSACPYAVMLWPLDAALARGRDQFDADLLVIAADGESDPLIEQCAALRALTDRPIAVLSDACDGDVVARAFEAGVDDVLSTSSSDQELFARLDALVRRWRAPAAGSWTSGGLVLSSHDLSVELRGRRVLLSPNEFRLLACLASAPGKVFTHDTLMSRVWGVEYVDARHYLYLYIRYLREKIEDDPTCPAIIVSEWGVGYRLEPVP